MIELFDRVYNCAHRGASGHAPENTLVALERACELGADMAEVDVQQTADGRLVLFHDATLGRTTNGAGPFSGRTLAELRTLDAGAWFGPTFGGERIPTLDEAMALVRGRLALNLELKISGPTFDLLDHVCAAITAADFAEHCVVTSFAHELIDELSARAPGFAVGRIIDRRAGLCEAWRTRCDVLSLEKSLPAPAVIEYAAAAGKAIHAWTVNDPLEMGDLADLGVGGIITNYPDLFPVGRTPQPKDDAP